MPANKDLSAIDEINRRVEPLFPGLMGVRVTELARDRVVAELTVRPDLCTAGGILHGGAYMAFADSTGALATVHRFQMRGVCRPHNVFFAISWRTHAAHKRQTNHGGS